MNIRLSYILMSIIFFVKIIICHYHFSYLSINTLLCLINQQFYEYPSNNTKNQSKEQAY